MSQYVDDGDGDNCLELPEELVSNHCAENWAEVAQHGEGVVDGGGTVLGEVELLVEINTEDSLHPVVGQSLTELISNDQKNLPRILDIHLEQT